MRYFAGFLVAIGLLVLVVILVIKGFTHHAPKVQQVTLADYASTNTVMQLTIDGPLVADELHQGLRITVGQTQNVIQTYQGYQNNVTSTQAYPSNQTAYDQFLRALQLYGFTRGNKDPNKADERGYCPNGDRYIYEILNDSNSNVQRWWSTSCGGQGNFAGLPNQVRQLFIKQIPDYNKIVSKVRL